MSRPSSKAVYFDRAFLMEKIMEIKEFNEAPFYTLELHDVFNRVLKIYNSNPECTGTEIMNHFRFIIEAITEEERREEMMSEELTKVSRRYLLLYKDNPKKYEELSHEMSIELEAIKERYEQ